MKYKSWSLLVVVFIFTLMLVACSVVISDDSSSASTTKNITDITAISAGGTHALALKNDGTVWAWGSNYSGQLGDGTTTDRYTPLQVIGINGITAISAGWKYTVALKNDGTVWAWGCK